MSRFVLDPDMLLGVGASAGVREKPDVEGNWREDVLLMRELGVKTCCLDVSWARLEPEESLFDRNALDDLREEILLLRGLHILPLLRFDRDTPPDWFLKKGGWENADNIRAWLLYIERVVREIGHLVCEYITFIEPNAYAMHAFLSDERSPAHRVRAMMSASHVMSVMATAHIRAYRLIHDLRRGLGFSDTKVGFSLQMYMFRVSHRMEFVRAGGTKNVEKWFHKQPLSAMATGHFTLPMRAPQRVRPGTYCDFLGVNYGGMFTWGGNTGVLHARRDDLGREINASGIGKCCRDALDVVGDMPIYITGISIADSRDVSRARFISEHLEVLSASGLPVARVYYQGLFDGKEENNACGLAGTDENGDRMLLRSGSFFAELIEEKGLSEEMYQNYVAGQEYPQ